MKTKLCLIVTLAVTLASNALAGSATWNLDPTSGDWNTAANWTPATVPNGSSDTATFGISNTTDVSLSSQVEVSTMMFNPSASAFSIAMAVGSTFTLSGAGIINNSGIPQTILIPVDASTDQVSIQFFNDATADADIDFIVNGTTTGQYGGTVTFLDQSSAGDATFTIKAGLQVGGESGGGRVQFFGKATAENGQFICEGAGEHIGGLPAQTAFYDTSSAGNAVIIAEGSDFIDGGGGRAVFYGKSNAANSTLVAYGNSGAYYPGQIVFSEGSTGGNAQVKVFGTGKLDIGTGSFKELTIGSLEGDGNVDLGEKRLSVGSHNASTTFRGIIFGTSGAKLIKIGTGTLVLMNENRYTGSTHIRRGKLLVNNTTGSGTGKGFVAVDGGVLGGSGTVDGPVTVGTGSGHNGMLEPGRASVAGTVFSIRKSLTLNSDAICRITLNSNKRFASEAAANGVTINGALFSIEDTGESTLTPGTVFTVIDNTAATPISGTFSNLADNGTVTISNNTYQASYEGGDGNDLTLTVVP